MAFVSSAPNLGAGGVRGQQVFVRDLAASTTTAISVNDVGQLANDAAFAPAANTGATFASAAHNLVGRSSANRLQVYLRTL